MYIQIIYNIDIYKIDVNLNNAQGSNNELIYYRASDIRKLIKTQIDRRNIAKELSKYILYNILYLYFPEKEKSFDNIFLLQVIAGKKISYNMYNIDSFSPLDVLQDSI